MQGYAIDTIELDGNGRHYSISYPNAYNTRDHLLNVLLGDAYILPNKGNLKPSQVIDVGANIGASAIFFRSHYPDIPIICYEPAAENLAFLRLNSQQAAPVEIMPYALSNKDGTARLYHGRMYGLQNSIHQSLETDGSRYEEIRIVDAGKELVAQIRPGTLLKLDTEGCEVEIIEAISSKLDDLLIIFLEFHSEDARRELDCLLKDSHTLFSGKVTDPHRGTFGYINTNAMRQIPELNRLKI